MASVGAAASKSSSGSSSSSSSTSSSSGNKSSSSSSLSKSSGSGSSGKTQNTKTATKSTASDTLPKGEGKQAQLQHLNRGYGDTLKAGNLLPRDLMGPRLVTGQDNAGKDVNLIESLKSLKSEDLKKCYDEKPNTAELRAADLSKRGQTYSSFHNFLTDKLGAGDKTADYLADRVIGNEDRTGVADFTPLGAGFAANESSRDYNTGNYWGAAFSAAALIPLPGAKGASKAVKEGAEAIAESFSKTAAKQAESVVAKQADGLAADAAANSLKSHATHQAYKVPFNPNLKHHLANFDGMGKDGVKGAHNRDEFLALQKSHDIKIVSEKQVGPGIYEIEYQYPKYFANHADAARSNKKFGDISHYKTADDPKTVYDPKVYSDEQMLTLAKEAAKKDFTKYSQNYKNYGTDRIYEAEIDVIKFQVYLDKDTQGNVFVSNVHPQG